MKARLFLSRFGHIHDTSPTLTTPLLNTEISGDMRDCIATYTI